MSLTAIVCCRPMTEKDIFLVCSDGKMLFSSIANSLIQKGIIAHFILVISNDVPSEIISQLHNEGIDIHISPSKAPQRRIREAMEQYKLDEALVLNGYSFLVGEDIVEELSQNRQAGNNLAAYVSKSPFRYACLLDSFAIQELCAPDQPPLPPNRLHCFHRLSRSTLRSSLVRPQDEYYPLDDCFWFLALSALHGQEIQLLGSIAKRLLDTDSQSKSLEYLLDEQLREYGIDLSSIASRHDAKSLHLYFKNKREIEFTWTPLLQRHLASKETFLEIGYGSLPYPSRSFSEHFSKGICLDPYTSPKTPLFKGRLNIAMELDEAFSNILPRQNIKPGQTTYHECELFSLGLEEASVDFCYSCSVLEHVEDMESMAKELRRLMRPDGLMLHTVDFTAHDQRKDGDIFPFYAHSKKWWLDNKPWLINLMRISDIIKIFKETGFDAKILHRNIDSRLPEHLHPDWQAYSREDLICGGAFIHFSVRQLP